MSQLALVRRDLPVWAVLALNLAELLRNQGGGGPPLNYPGPPAHEVCACREEPTAPVGSAAAATADSGWRIALELDEAVRGAAGLVAWLGSAGEGFQEEAPSTRDHPHAERHQR